MMPPDRCACGHLRDEHVDDGEAMYCSACECDTLEHQEGGYGPMGTSANPDA